MEQPKSRAGGQVTLPVHRTLVPLPEMIIDPDPSGQMFPKAIDEPFTATGNELLYETGVSPSKVSVEVPVQVPVHRESNEGGGDVEPCDVEDDEDDEVELGLGVPEPSAVGPPQAARDPPSTTSTMSTLRTGYSSGGQMAVQRIRPPGVNGPA